MTKTSLSGPALALEVLAFEDMTLTERLGIVRNALWSYLPLKVWLTISREALVRSLETCHAAYSMEAQVFFYDVTTLALRALRSDGDHTEEAKAKRVAMEAMPSDTEDAPLWRAARWLVFLVEYEGFNGGLAVHDVLASCEAACVQLADAEDDSSVRRPIEVAWRDWTIGRLTELLKAEVATATTAQAATTKVALRALEDAYSAAPGHEGPVWRRAIEVVEGVLAGSGCSEGCGS